MKNKTKVGDLIQITTNAHTTIRRGQTMKVCKILNGFVLAEGSGSCWPVLVHTTEYINLETLIDVEYNEESPLYSAKIFTGVALIVLITIYAVVTNN